MQPQPRFSVVVPTHERPGQLGRCLEGLSRLCYPKGEFEVVVVDDGSNTSPKTVIDAFQNRLRLRLVHQRRAGPAAARNTGAARAVGELLAFLDDDCVPSPKWLTVLDLHLHDSPNRLVGGPMRNAVTTNLYSAASQLVIDSLYAHYNVDSNSGGFLASSNMAATAERFRRVGGFDPSFPLAGGEDRELCERWRVNGGTIHYVPDALVHHRHALTLRSLWRQHANYGIGTSHLHRVRLKRGEARARLEPALYATMLRLALKSAGRRRLSLVGLLSMTQVAYAAGFLAEEVRFRVRGRAVR